MRGYIIGVETLSIVYFQFLPRVSEQRQVNFTEAAVTGANNAVGHVTGGSSTITVDAGFYSVTATKKDVIGAVRKLEQFTYSRDNGGGVEKVRLVLGKLYEGREFVLLSVNANPDLFDISKNFVPNTARVTLTLKETYQNLNRNSIKW